jgi:hypothetical protein
MIEIDPKLRPWRLLRCQFRRCAAESKQMPATASVSVRAMGPTGRFSSHCAGTANSVPSPVSDTVVPSSRGSQPLPSSLECEYGNSPRCSCTAPGRG